MNWRFYERPDKEYDVIIHKNENNLIEGYIICTSYKDKNGLNRCQIADYDYNVNNVFKYLLNKVTQLALKHDCSTVEFLVNEDHFDTELLRVQSFVRKEESYKMFLNGDSSELDKGQCFKFEFGYFDVI